MPKNLKTDWKRIGRSGPTVDGRMIEPQALEQASDSYNKDVFTALIWPDHIRWFNMGMVEELRTESNDEGGVDLFAVIAPNDFYLESNLRGQRLFTSMELQPNFRDTGGYYLTGLAATDNPASAATSEMRFTAGADKTALLSTFTENVKQTFSDQHDEPPRWFANLFKPKPNEDDMSKEALAALAERFTAIEEKITSLTEKNADTDEASTDETETDDLNSKKTQVQTLTEQVTALTNTLAVIENHSNSEITALKQELDDLTVQFNAALNDESGTDGGEHDGDNFNSDQYI